MTDRGLYARGLFHEIVALGWHPWMRITPLSQFRKAGAKSNVPVTALVPEVGRRWQGRGVAFPRKPERRLPCPLLACWEPRHAGPWFVVTDLGPGQAEALGYGMRAWIEPGFKLLKRGGWQWQATRMTAPERAGRLGLVLAVATRSVLAVGGEAEAGEMAVETIPGGAVPATGSQASGRPESPVGRAAWWRHRAACPGPTPRLVSVFRQGVAALVSLLIAGHSLPEPQWKPEPWLEIRAEIKTSTEQPPTPIPKNPSL